MTVPQKDGSSATGSAKAGDLRNRPGFAMNVAEVIERLLILEGLSDKKDIPRVLDVEPGTLLKQIQRGQIPIEILADYAINKRNISINWLLTGKGNPHGAVEIVSPELHVIDKKHVLTTRMHDDYVPIPLIADSAAAGPPRLINERDIEGYVVIYNAWCRNTDDFTAIRVRGNSMQPTLPDGCIVAINHAKRDLSDLMKKMTAFRYHGGVTIKRLYYDKDKGIVVGKPDNPDSPEIVTLTGDEIATGIIGKVEWWWGRER
ncbi:MAG: helix-turn-helix domain-containing protein [Nitrospirae bacterium]|nr:helix-turn-helix domain-containing protein [Nitrospirota bacterium]MBI5696605.1 helix-turn-helix domain-containing protein [Nitrospirota bacterium]